jgi:hypothetical protein
MANLLATEQVRLGDMICIDWEASDDHLHFVREGENVAIPVRRPDPAIAAKPTQARGGRPVEAPSVQVPPEPTPRLAR